MKPFYLYKITNLINLKVYIGMTGDVQRRKYQHFNHRSGKTISVIKLAIDKYGPDNFEFKILCIGSREYIVELEKKAIISYDSISNGYNIRAGGEGGSGHTISKRSDDTPLYVMGFWFPNARTCLRYISISKGSLYRMIREGRAGQFKTKSKVQYLIDSPTYVAGFWFDTLERASYILNKTIPTIRKRLYDGFIEQKGISRPSGSDHVLTGRKGKDCHNSKPVYVNGTLYDSIKIASQHSKYSECTISRGLKNKDPRFSYKVNENIEV